MAGLPPPGLVDVPMQVKALGRTVRYLADQVAASDIEEQYGKRGREAFRARLEKRSQLLHAQETLLELLLAGGGPELSEPDGPETVLWEAMLRSHAEELRAMLLHLNGSCEPEQLARVEQQIGQNLLGVLERSHGDPWPEHLTRRLTEHQDDGPVGGNDAGGR